MFVYIVVTTMFNFYVTSQIFLLCDTELCKKLTWRQMIYLV